MVAKTVERFSVAMMCGAALAALLTMTSIVLPYAPMDMRSIELDQASACALSGVDASVDYTLDPQFFDSISSLEVESEWVAVDADGLAPGSRRQAIDTVIPKELLIPGKRDAPSRALRVAPEAPGTWGLETTTLVRGRAFGFVPKVQRVETVSASTLQVVSMHDPSCP